MFFVPLELRPTDIAPAANPVGLTVAITKYGKPSSEKSLTGRMGDWTKSAALN